MLPKRSSEWTLSTPPVDLVDDLIPYVAKVVKIQLPVSLSSFGSSPVNPANKVEWTENQRGLASQAVEAFDLNELQNMVCFYFYLFII